MAQSGKVNHNFGSVINGQGSIKRTSVELLSDSSFATQAAAAVSNLQYNGSDFRLPVGAFITACAVKATTTVVGGTTFDIGVDTTTETADDTLFADVTLANVNLGAINIPAAVTLVGDVTLVGSNFVTVTVLTTPNTAGAIKVYLEFIQFE